MSNNQRPVRLSAMELHINSLKTAGFKRGYVGNPKHFTVRLGERNTVGFNLNPTQVMIFWYAADGKYLEHEAQNLKTGTWEGIKGSLPNYAAVRGNGLDDDEGTW